MLKTLPFSALRTLESVTRLNGFGRAAEELNVTQSAVSQHIKQLEEWTGQKLLIRGARKTVPTESGLRLASATAEGFGTVQLVCDDLRDKNMKTNRGILVAAPPGFAFVWLLPRLFNFDSLHPELPVSISTEIFARDFNADAADVMIQYGLGGFPGLHAEQLMPEKMVPVCSPELAVEIDTVDDLAKFTILQDDVNKLGVPPTWDVWAGEAGVKLPKFSNARKFGQANMIIQAAKAGHGVAMGRAPLSIDGLQDGSLACPLPIIAHSQLSYWFVCRHEMFKTKRVKIFRDWIFEEVKNQPDMATLLSGNNGDQEESSS